MSVTAERDRCRAGEASEQVRKATGRGPTRAIAVEG